MPKMIFFPRPTGVSQHAIDTGKVTMCSMVEYAQDLLMGAVTALRERLASAPDGWQPIETAPKTGRKVILFYLNRNNLPRTVMARWLTDEEAAETDADGVGLEGGWYECIDNWDDYTEVAIHEGEPTHWMPLPAAPQQGDKP